VKPGLPQTGFAQAGQRGVEQSHEAPPVPSRSLAAPGKRIWGRSEPFWGVHAFPHRIPANSAGQPWWEVSALLLEDAVV